MKQSGHDPLTMAAARAARQGPSPLRPLSHQRPDNRLAHRRAARTMERVLRVNTWIMSALWACLLAGCAIESPPPRSRAIRPTPAARSMPVTAHVSEPAPIPVPSPLTPEPVVMVAPPAPPAATGMEWPSNWANAWIALESWGRFNGLEAPRQYGSGFGATYQLSTSNGVMMLKPGGQTLRFAGLDFWLGFAPRLIQGRPYIHAIDARKTLQPLLGTLAFPIVRSNRTIVIDAGHGGKDSGTRSCVNGEDEKQYALDWARRVQRLLTARGWNVVMTRTNDTFLALADRVDVAERAKADLFLSLHFNAAPGSSDQAGVETYCLPPAGMPSTLRRGFADDPGEVLPNNAFDDENFGWATALHRSVLAATGAQDRGVCRARFLGVLRGQNRPAVLVEGGYLSNPAEARSISSPAHRQALAEGIAKALE